MNLVVAGELRINESTCTELALLQEISESTIIGDIDPDKERELARLQLEKKRKQNALDEAQDKIIRVNDALIANNQDLVKEIERLEEEHEQIMREILEDSMRKQGREKTSFKREDSEESEQSQEDYLENEADEWKTQKSHVSAKVKKLFQKIANKTHPDKTQKDTPSVREEKQRMFMRAKLLRDLNDYDGLHGIWLSLKDMQSSLLQRLLGRIEIIKQEIKLIQKEIDALVGTRHFRMAVSYENGDVDSVNNYYRKVLEATIRDKINEIRALDSERYKPTVVMPSDEDMEFLRSLGL